MQENLRVRFYEYSRWFWIILFAVAGLAHFVVPGFFIAHYPDYLPWPKFAVYGSGALEWVLAVLLFLRIYPKWTWLAIAVLMLLYLPVHVYVITHHDQIDYPQLPIPLWLAWVRLPIQFLFIAWPVYCFWMLDRGKFEV